MNKQQLANKIWESANKMRSKIEANEYKDYILGFIFYKFLSDKETEYLKRNGWSAEELPELVEEDTETVDQCKDSIGYFIAYENLFSTWLGKGKDFDVSNVTDALSDFSRLIGDNYKKVFDKIFDTLQTGLSKLGETSGARTKAINGLLNLIKDIPMDQRQGYDVLGFIYEYLISNFAANAGKKAGEFYTPHEVSLLMSEIVANHLKARDTIAIYDPTSGSGSLLINIGKSASKYMDSNRIQYYAQELKENTYNLTRMNLVMRGIEPSNIFTRNADTLEDDWPIDIESYPPVLRVDAVVSNPPYSQQWNPEGKDSDSRYAGYGVAPKSKADYAFLLHDLYHIKPDGIMTIVLPHGVLFRGGEEGEIRKNLIERNNIDAVIGLPANIFFGTGIPTIIMILKQNRENSDVLIIDASKGFKKEGKNNKLRSSDIRRIADTYIQRLDVPKYSRKVSRDEIRSNDYNLNIPRYVDSSETAETWDIYASMFGGIPDAEIENLNEFWSVFPGLKNDLFRKVSAEYSEIAGDDVKTLIYSHSDVLNFLSAYNEAFSDFSEFLHTELIDSVTALVASKEETVISADVFGRLTNIPLVDPYEAYQILDDYWIVISADIEIIQTEGFDAVRKVDTNIVIKKKNGKDVEVQEGYLGHVFPFELVQRIYLSAEVSEIKDKETRLSEIDGEIEELFENLDEETKEADFVNDDKTAFVPAEVRKAIKTKAAEGDVLAALQSFEKLTNEGKDLKKQVKELSTALHQKTKETIEELTDEQACELLHEKWITPFANQLNLLPENIISSLCAKVNALAGKYKVTFAQVDEEIKKTETELSSMIEELSGSDFDMQGLWEFKKLLCGF